MVARSMVSRGYRSQLLLLSISVGIAVQYINPLVIALILDGWKSAESYAGSHLSGNLFSLSGGIVYGIIIWTVVAMSARRRRDDPLGLNIN